MEFTYAKSEEKPAELPEEKLAEDPKVEVPVRAVPKMPSPKQLEKAAAHSAGVLRAHPGAIVAPDGTIQLHPEGTE